ncbi:MAG: DUF6282 family protein [Pseudomonadota bacterium]
MFEDQTRLKAALETAGVVDTHYHVGPELVTRRYDVKSLADVAAPFGATLVLKNHTYPTTPLASLARKQLDARFYGGVVLNHYVGGLNPAAVTGAMSGNRTDVQDEGFDPSPVVVWMPTVHSAAEMANLGENFGQVWLRCCARFSEIDDRQQFSTPVVAFDDDLKPTKALTEVIEAIAANGCVLATGHLSALEILRLVPMALEIGVKKIILTHPHYPVVGLTDENLAQLCKQPEVFAEHCFAVHTDSGIALKAFADSIRHTGPDQVLLSTDFGQIGSDPFPDGTLRYAEALADDLRDFVSEDLS